MNRLLKISLSALFSLTTQWSYATSSSGLEPVKAFLEMPKSANELFAFMSMAGASSDSLRVLETEARKQLNNLDAELPKIKLRRNMIFVNGKSTGMRVVSVDPLNIEDHNRTWAYDKTQPVDVNVHSLNDFMKGQQKAALLDLILPKAYATDLPWTAAGAWAGGASGLAVVFGLAAVGVVISNPVGWGIAGVGLAAGIALGLRKDLKDRRAARLIEEARKSEVHMTCSDKEVVVSTGYGSTRLNKKLPPGSKGRIELTNASGAQVKIPQALEVATALMEQLASCKDGNDAGRFLAEYNSHKSAVAGESSMPRADTPRAEQ